jgi:uncharacterized protein (DUF1810 family)
VFDLERFRRAQAGDPGVDQALRELKAGAKTSHWIWYVFPQLRGLGRSSMAIRYGLDGLAEATAYVGDEVLADRLAAATAAVRAHLTAKPGPLPLDELMGADIDALKLVSSMTLFAHVARAENARRPRPALAALADDAAAVLDAAAAQGYPRCAFTKAQIEAAGEDSASRQ